MALRGLDRLERNLATLGRNFASDVEAALYQEAKVEQQESMRRTPVDTGALRASHETETRREGRDIVARISVGGPAASYAVYVHENLEAQHPVGQAKFLESTLMESRPFLGQRIARRVEDSIRRRVR